MKMKSHKKTTKRRMLPVGMTALLMMLLVGYSMVSNQKRLLHYKPGSSSTTIWSMLNNSLRPVAVIVTAEYLNSSHNHTLTTANQRQRLLHLYKLAMEILQVESSTVKENVDLDDLWNATTFVTNASYDDDDDEQTIRLLKQRLGQTLRQAGLDFLVPCIHNATTTLNASTATATTDWPHSVVLENILAVRRYRITHQKTFGHFLVHIPKSGASFAFVALGNLLWSHFDYAQLVAARRQDAYRPCNVATAKTFQFHSSKWMGHYKDHVCNLWMAESAWTSRAQRAYVVVRNPRHHVLSQYFHCLESAEHVQKKIPNNLTVWLQAWNDAVFDNNVTLRLERRQQNRKFFCYKPVNLQSTYIWPSLSSQVILNLTSATAAAWAKHTQNTTETRQTQNKMLANMLIHHVLRDPSPTNNASFSLDDAGEKEEGDPFALLAQDLLNRFEVVGDTSRMVLSVCLIFLKYTGWMAPQCDCTHHHSRGDNEEDETRLGNSKRGLTESTIEYHPDRHAHGVQHHGATFQTTLYQDSLIDRLTQFDQLLYDIGKQVLDIQVDQVEKEYQVRVCRTHFRTLESK